MSEIGYCPRGGQSGIVVTQLGLRMLAWQLNSEYIDRTIPLPGVSIKEQKEKIEACNCLETEDYDSVDLAYWETDKGSHGWCCRDCGQVHQWG